jgi:hypothetical protein
MSKLVNFKGTVTRIEWMFPHGHFYVDVAGADGEVEAWTFETANPAQFVNRGVGRDFLKQGDEVSITAWVAKKQTHSASARTLTLSDGRSVDVGDRWNPIDMGKK